MKVTLIPTVIGALGRIAKGLVKGLGDIKIRLHVETLQTTVLLRSARIQKIIQKTCPDLLSSESLVKDYQLTLV